MREKPKARKVPSRKQVTFWLALALCHVPPNLCAMTATGVQIPPQWVKDAKAECRRIGIKFTQPKQDERPGRKSRRR